MPTPLTRRSLALLASALGLAGAAQAASVHIVFDNPIFNGSGYDVVQIQYPGLAPGAPTVTQNVAAGRFQGTGSNVVGVDPGIFVDGLDNLYMYCYDVYERITHGQAVNYTINLDGELARTRDFLGAVNAVINAGKAVLDPFAWLHPVDKFQGAAIQLGIWESRYESSPAWDLAGGVFRASGLDAPTAGYWDAFRLAIDSTEALTPIEVMTLEVAGAQDMITADPPVQVPEPGTLALLGLAGAALALQRRRRH